MFRLTFLLAFFLGGPLSSGAERLPDETLDEMAQNLSRQANLLAFLAPRLGELLA